jgi:CubicO group peptidase (beta-lactamase class C family)
VFSNVADLARFVTVLMDDGKPAFSPKVVKALTTPHADIPGSQAKYGYGLDLEDRAGFQVWTHGGSRAGYGSFIAMMPSLHAGLIVLCNRTGENLPKTRAMIMAMLGEPLRGGVPLEETSIPPTEFGRYLGSYRNGDATVQIVTRAGKLFFRQAELKKSSDGFLVMKTPDGRTTGRVFPVFGPDGKIEYLHQGGRSSVRVQ